MTTKDMNLWDIDVWSFILVFTVLMVSMIIANILIRRIKPLRTLMIPNSVLGGFLVLFIDYIFKLIWGQSMFSMITGKADVAILEILTYHGLGLGFVAITLRSTEKSLKNKKNKDYFNSGLVVVTTYLLQGIFSLGITIGLSYILKNVYAASGIIAPLGYGQGPGQAYNWGHNFEVAGFTNGTSFGLTVAAMGFVSASIGGVIYLNVMRRKKRISGNEDADGSFEQKELSAADITGKNEIPLSESMDKLTVQIALVFIAYAMAYGFMYAINSIVEAGWLGGFGSTIQSLIWGFNFLFGLLFAIVLKQIMKLLKKTGVMKRDYTNDFFQTRISGFMFDLMVVASIAAIDLSAFRYKEFIIPLAAICLVSAIITYTYLDITCKRLFPTYRDESFLALYGMLTGTASTGIILLRAKDPEFKTPAADNLVGLQGYAIAFGFPLLLLLPYTPENPVFVFTVVTVMFIAIGILLFRKQIFKKRKDKKK